MMRSCPRGLRRIMPEEIIPEEVVPEEVVPERDNDDDEDQPQHLRELQGTPLAIHHHIVKEVLDESMLPVVCFSLDRRHIGAFHTINNGHDLLDSFGAARVMSEIWGKRMDAVDDKDVLDVFVSEYRPLMGGFLCNRLWDHLKFEKDHEVI
ncbi:NAD(P)-binding protein [Diaporthe eres]|nr:NAD(P)-binding protein [Diaporthe eres]